MTADSSLIHAILLNGLGAGHALNWTELEQWSPDQGVLWLHFQLDQSGMQPWIKQQSGLDPLIVEVLCSEDNHPRIVWEGDTLYGTMRGVNFNRGADHEDMVFVNFWMDANRVITVRGARVMTIQEIALDLKQGRGPNGTGGLLATILERLHDRMEPILEEIESDLDNYEQLMLTQEENENMREDVMKMRNEIIGLRRFLSPQKTALAVLTKSSPPWLSKKRMREIVEIDNNLQRFLSDLESYRERAIVIREEINSLVAERMNRGMYMLSVITGVFLPLGFLTGLLGINVGGMPGTDNPSAFWIVCALLTCISIASLILFRRKQWI